MNVYQRSPSLVSTTLGAPPAWLHSCRSHDIENNSCNGIVKIKWGRFHFSYIQNKHNAVKGSGNKSTVQFLFSVEIKILPDESQLCDYICTASVTSK